MPRKGKKGPKDPWQGLDEEERAAMDGEKDNEKLKGRIAKAAMDSAAFAAAKREDQDLKAKSQAATEAGAVYREAAKTNGLRIAYAMVVLKGRGVDVPSVQDIVKTAQA